MSLGGRTVIAPDGAEWHVGRQWFPWRLRRRSLDSPDLASLDAGGAADDLIGIVIAIFVGLVIVLLLFTVVIPLVALAVELIALLVVFFWGVGTRLILRRPWSVRASSGSRELVYKVRGFRRSGRVRDEVAEALARGEAQPRPAEAITA